MYAYAYALRTYVDPHNNIVNNQPLISFSYSYPIVSGSGDMMIDIIIIIQSLCQQQSHMNPIAKVHVDACSKNFINRGKGVGE